MASGVWKGVGSGLILFFVIVAVGALTPLRIPLLKIAGRDYTALQLQEQAATSKSPQVSSGEAPARERVAVRMDAWHKRNERLSVFGLLGWFMDLWPWLLGLSVGLPVLGGLIGTQTRAPAGTQGGAAHAEIQSGAAHAETQSGAAHAARGGGEPAVTSRKPEKPRPQPAPPAPSPPSPPPPENPRVASAAPSPGPAELSPPAVDATEPPVVPAAPAAPATPLPPSEWNWNAGPAARRVPPRPKPPPVQSPNADAM